jgi:hypothetical protein
MTFCVQQTHAIGYWMIRKALSSGNLQILFLYSLHHQHSLPIPEEVLQECYFQGKMTQTKSQYSDFKTSLGDLLFFYTTLCEARGDAFG